MLTLCKGRWYDYSMAGFVLFPVMEQLSHQVFKVTSNPLTSNFREKLSLKGLLWNSLKSNVFHAARAIIGTILLIGLVIYGLALFRKKHCIVIYIIALYLY